MHIKFLKHGQGMASSAVRYLLQTHDHNGDKRAEVAVLHGDPHLVALVADSSRHRWRYTSGVIAWAPTDKPSPSEIQAVIEEWEATAFAGLEPDQYATCAVLHRDDDGTPHVHTLTARVELASGRALNIAPPGHHRLFDPLRDAWNYAQGWSRPDDPDRARNSQPGNEAQGRSRPDRHLRNRAEITTHIEALVAEGFVTNAADVRKALAEVGEITRASHAFVSVRPHGEKSSIRLRGDLFRDNWRIEQTLEREARRAAQEADGRAGRRDTAAAERARKRLAAATERRAAYHRDRYPQAEREDDFGVERVQTTTSAADPRYRGALGKSGESGRALGSGRGYSELDTPSIDYLIRDVDRRGDNVRRLATDRPAHRQPPGATGDAPSGDPAGRAVAKIASGGRDPHAERRLDLFTRSRPGYHVGRNDQRRPDSSNSIDEGVTADDRAGNSAVAAVSAAAERIRAAGDRVVRTARQAANCAEQAAGRQPSPTPRDGTERLQERRSDRATDRARRALVIAAEQFDEEIQRVTTAYQAWMARQAERDRQDREKAAREYDPKAFAIPHGTFDKNSPSRPRMGGHRPVQSGYSSGSDMPGL
ncbi:relaxase/mobilization nuclease domain-containing protein [Halomonas alkaliantarctica]|nr:relaxase/mobilization nuclease domain-containing protein [Halomonas alkaliantarctica]